MSEIQRYNIGPHPHKAYGLEPNSKGKLCKSEDVEALEKRVKELEEAQRWRSVEDELPEKSGKYVIQWDFGALGCATYDNTGTSYSPIGWFTDDDFQRCINRRVAKWMPLPAKGGSDD